MMAQKKSRLPSEYQEVEYLQSSGTQFIRTNLYANQTYSVYLTYQCINTGPHMFFGARDESSGVYANSFVGGVAIAGYVYGQFGTGGTNLATIHYDANKHVFFMSKDGWYLDNVKYRTFNQSAFKGIYPLLVFAGNNGTVITYSHCRIFSLLISSSDIPMLNLVPCYRKSDHKPGMYDLVTKTFFTNAGTGEFIVGADVK